MTPDVGTDWFPSSFQNGVVSPVVTDAQAYAGSKGLYVARPVGGGSMHHSIGTGVAIDITKEYLVEAMVFLPSTGPKIGGVPANGFRIVLDAGTANAAKFAIGVDTDSPYGAPYVQVLQGTTTPDSWLNRYQLEVEDYDVWQHVQMRIDMTTQRVFSQITNMNTGDVHMLNNTAGLAFYGGNIDAAGLANGFEVAIGPDQPYAITGTNESFYDEVKITAIPEPATMSFVSLGLLGLLRRKRS